MNPFRVNLTNGSYLQWDYHEGHFRVAFYNRTTAKSSDMEMCIAIAMKKPLHNKAVHDLFKFIQGTEEYEEINAASTKA
jgi:hypothetical protein